MTGRAAVLQHSAQENKYKFTRGRYNLQSTHTQGCRVGGCAGHSVPPDPPHMLLAQPGNYREPPTPYPNDPYSAGDPPYTTAHGRKTQRQKLLERS